MKMRVIPSLILGSIAMLSVSSASAATVTSATPEMLAEALLGSNSNISVVPGSIEFIGTSTQSGIYTGFGSMPNGILMTTGDALDHGPALLDYDSAHVMTNTGSNATLSLIAGGPTNDQNVLTFSFTVNDSSLDAISTSFVLASNEYPDWLGSEFRDVFAFFVDGVNYATFPDGSRVIATETDAYMSGYDVGYNGKTLPISLIGLLDPELTVHTLTIAIADVGDRVFDSGVFIASLSSFDCADCTSGVINIPTIPEPETWAMLLAGLGIVGVTAKRRRRQK